MLRFQTQTPVPVEPVRDLGSNIDSSTIGLYIVGGIIVMVAALLMSMALRSAAKQPAPSALITALSMLTLFAIAGGIATNNDEAWTIAAAGVGALAGSVTALFQEEHYKALLVAEPPASLIEHEEPEDES